MKILGTKFFGHDSAICYLDTERKEIFAISTERVTRIKHDWYDISPILEEYPFLKEVDFVCHSFANFSNEDTCIETKANSINLLMREKYLRKILQPKYIKDFNVNLKKIILRQIFFQPFTVAKFLYYHYIYKFNTNKVYSPKDNKNNIEKYIQLITNNKNIKFYDHHLCHAIGAYYTSPFVKENKDVLSLTLDGQGDGYFSKLFLINNKKYKLISDSKVKIFDLNGKRYVTSIGEIYGNFTEALGLRRNSDEGKVEALAAFGKINNDLYMSLRESIKIQNLSFVFDIDKVKKFYDYNYLKSIRHKIGDENFACTIQRFLEDIVVEYINEVLRHYPHIDTLCLSGGVAANIIMNLNIYERTSIKNIHIFPAMADDGTALGSAILCALENNQDVSWVSEKYFMPYYGNSIDKNEIEKALRKFSNLIYWEYVGGKWPELAAQDIINNKIIAIVQGRMEFGPRALGNRTIAANAFNPTIKDKINSTVKRRPWYQPFCPSILEEDRERLFEKSFNHKHMAIAFRVKEEYRNKIPSAIHIDGTARPQFVEETDNPDYYRLLKKVKEKTGFGVIINTSFNLHGRTIVRTAEDSIIDFIDCNIDVLYLEGYRITRREK